MSEADDEVRVLVVDDFPDVAEMLAMSLRLDGYVVRVAHDGAEAVEAVESFSPHCVMLDVDMPGIDGAELSRMLRQRYGDDIVLIAVTGWGQNDARVKETFARVDHYLAKPIEAEKLRKLLPPVH